MKRLLRFFPAVLAGLLAGWAISVRLRPDANANASPQGSNVSATGTDQPDAGKNSAWQKLLESRAGLPGSLQDAGDFVERGQSILADRALSPFRRALEIEKLRSTLPVSLLDSTVNVAWSLPQGLAGIAEAMVRLAKEDPKRAYDALNGLVAARAHGWTDSHSNERLRVRILREWLRQDPEAALAAVTGGGSDYERGFRLQSLMEAWSQIDPAAAAAALPTLPEAGAGFDRKNYAETLFRQWHQSDPAAARQWAQMQTDPALRESLNTLADELAASSLSAKALVLLAAPQRESHKLATALGEWLASEPVAAMERLTAIPADDKFWQQDAANAAEWWAIDARSSMTPEQFLEAISSVPAGAQREAILKGLAHYGASNDIPFAVRMVAEMTEGRPREEAIGSLTELWMRKDHVKTSEWLATLPADTDSRHAGVARFAELLAPDDPERAAQWATSIPDGYWQKQGVLNTILERWRATDPAAAAAWQAGQSADG